jgi:hypothetical protein
MFGTDMGAGATFGVGTAQDVEELNKALTTGAYTRGGNVGGSSAGDGSALRVESLESTLKVTTYSERHIVFWKDIPKLPAFNTVEEFNQLNSYGNQGGFFVPEGTTPEASDSRYDRKVVQVKYLGSLRQVTHVMTLVRPAHGDVIALETLNGTRELLRTLEESLFWGNSACNTYEWDGMYKQLTDGFAAEDGVENVVDMRGAALDEKTLGEAARIVVDNYGFPTAMYMGFQTMQDVNTLLLNKQRLMLPNTVSPAGAAVNAFQTVGGMYDFKPSVFLKPGRDLPSASKGDAAKIPALAGVTITNSVAASDPLSKMSAATHVYSYTLENRFGETTGAGALSVTYTAGQSSTITVGAIPGTATAVNLFRKSGSSAVAKFIKRIPVSAGSAAYIDRDLNIPGTSMAFLLQVDLDVMSFKQLAPFTKIPLATIDPSIRWMQLLYGTPAVYAPKKCVVVKNIGSGLI